MHLMIGGSYQGKLQYARELYPDAVRLVDGKNCSLDLLKQKEVWTGAFTAAPVIFDHLHLFVHRLMERERDPLGEIAEFLEQRDPEDLPFVWICDEVGYGLISMDPFENRYREMVGRCLCRITPLAAQVDRIVAGLPLCLKKQQEERI